MSSAETAATAVGILLLASGCSLFHDAALEDRFEYTETTLGPAEIAVTLEEADRLHGEPRSVERVEKSLSLSLGAIAPGDEHGALWRAARACYWLAENHGDGERCREYALRGSLIAREGARLAPGRPEPWYFQALNLGILSRLEGRGLGRIAVMEELARKVIEIDERYEHAGGHRFLGILYHRTMDNPLTVIGDIDDALFHLRRACELFPNHGHNQLALAEVLLADEEFDLARESLRRVLASPTPPGETEDHGRWVRRARELLGELESGRGT